MRLCPTVEGNATPLITHLIGVDVCLSRQRGFYHKCHRCLYRGKAASWEPGPELLAAARAIETTATVVAHKAGLPS